MNTNDNATKSNEKIDVAKIAFPVGFLEAVLVVIITQMTVGGIATVISILAFFPLMLGAFVGGALGKRAGGDWKGVAKAAVFGSLLVLALGFACMFSQP